MKKDDNILITGNLGYIGPELVKKFSKKYNIIGVDAGWFNNPLINLNLDSVTQYVFDIRSEKIEDIFKKHKISAVLHLANISNDPMGNLAEDLTNEINLTASFRLAEVSKKYGVEKFINFSSCSVYGFNSQKEYLDEDDLKSPVSAYAKCKVKLEEKLADISNDKFIIINMRNSTVFGCSDNLRLDLVANDFLFNAYFNKKISILSDGKPWRPMVHVKDIADLADFFVENTSQNTTVNIGSNELNVQVRDIAESISKKINSDLEIKNLNPSDKRSYKVSFDKLKNITNKNDYRDFDYFSNEFQDMIKEHKLIKESFLEKDTIRLKKLSKYIVEGKIPY